MLGDIGLKSVELKQTTGLLRIVYKYKIEVQLDDYHRMNSLIFEDMTGDIYKLNTISPGKHWIAYNSKNPTIKEVTGVFDAL